MKVRCFITAMFVLFAVGMLANLCYAEINPDSILGIWLFDDGGDNVIADSSENGFDGTIAGVAQFSEGKFGEALELNGGDNYVDFGADEKLKPQTFTVVAWFNTSKASGHRHIFQSGHDWDDMAGIVFRINQNNNLQGAVTQGPGNTVSWVGGPIIDVDTWYHGAITFDGTSIIMYLDGVPVGNGGGTQVLYDDTPVRVGSHTDQSVSLFGGLIDEVAYFSEALEEADIVDIMNLGLEVAVNIAAVSSVDKLTTTWAGIKKW